jgi:3' terminal RNA ribose 2'-O-methyltransferase Hen1
MLLTIETTYQPATDLGYLLHKHPGRVHVSEHPYGSAYLFYPHADPERCQVALLLEVEPLSLLRGRTRANPQWALGQYVNDRPYAVTSLLSTVINRELRQALKGRCSDRPELVETALPLTARLCAVVSPDGEDFLRGIFEPLGYSVDVERYPLDEYFPEWGAGPVFALELRGEKTLSELLTHLYVLIPVLDNSKHYWVAEAEIAKLLDYGAGWLAAHPQRELITKRYLKHQGALTREALAQLADESEPDPDAALVRKEQEEQDLERPLNLHQARIATVAETLAQSGAQRVLDLGCGEGLLLAELLKQRQFTEIVGVDVAQLALSRAEKRLQLERLPSFQRDRIRLLQGALTYRDDRLAGYDAAALVEVIEHLDPHRLAALELSVFKYMRPGTVVVTTPNREYNALWPSLPAGRLRHRDHRFEWTRAEFGEWVQRIAAAHGYAVTLHPVGPEDPALGAPTQMGVFTR